MLNNLQIQIINGSLDLYLDDILEKGNETAFAAVLDEKIYSENSKSFQEQIILDSIDQLRKIYKHSYPQNRANSGVFPANPTPLLKKHRLRNTMISHLFYMHMLSGT